MQFKQIIERALQVRAKYVQFEQKLYGKGWTTAQIAEGFIGDVGDLMKLILAKQGVRDISDVDSKLAHELSDCLWSILILASELDIDLERSFFATMDSLDERIDQKLQS